MASRTSFPTFWVSILGVGIASRSSRPRRVEVPHLPKSRTHSRRRLMASPPALYWPRARDSSRIRLSFFSGRIGFARVRWSLPAYGAERDPRVDIVDVADFSRRGSAGPSSKAHEANTHVRSVNNRIALPLASFERHPAREARLPFFYARLARLSSTTMRAHTVEKSLHELAVTTTPDTSPA
jgi:hypothetical protein